MTIYYREIKTVLGPVVIMMHHNYVIRLDYGTSKIVLARVKPWIKRYFGDVNIIRDDKIAPLAVNELDDYFKGHRFMFTFKTKMYGTSYQKYVWNILKDDVPYGETWTYKDVAEAIQNPQSVRAVGGAVGKNPLSIVVPCHRIIGSDGKLVGYAGGLNKKIKLLRHEQKNKNSN